jgi:hypothetical protein
MEFSHRRLLKSPTVLTVSILVFITVYMTQHEKDDNLDGVEFCIKSSCIRMYQMYDKHLTSLIETEILQNFMQCILYIKEFINKNIDIGSVSLTDFV